MSSSDKVAWPPRLLIETPFFLWNAAGLLTDGKREQWIAFVGTNSEAGAVMPESGRVRNLRGAAKGKGKNGRVMVICHFHSEALPVS
jgi:hypothetical protein